MPHAAARLRTHAREAVTKYSRVDFLCKDTVERTGVRKTKMTGKEEESSRQ